MSARNVKIGATKHLICSFTLCDNDIYRYRLQIYTSKNPGSRRTQEKKIKITMPHPKNEAKVELDRSENYHLLYPKEREWDLRPYENASRRCCIRLSSFHSTIGRTSLLTQVLPKHHEHLWKRSLCSNYP